MKAMDSMEPMSEFADRVAALRAARVADLDLIIKLHEQICSLNARVGALEAETRRQHERPEASIKLKAAARARGLFCNYCGKPFGAATKTKSVFCSRGCSNRWHHQHPGMLAQPRLSLNGDRFQSTIVAGVGERPTG